MSQNVVENQLNEDDSVVMELQCERVKCMFVKSQLKDTLISWHVLFHFSLV